MGSFNSGCNPGPSPCRNIPYVYSIYLADSQQAAQLAAQYPNGIKIPPAQASTIYNAPIIPFALNGSIPVPAGTPLPWIIIEPQTTQAILRPSIVTSSFNCEFFVIGYADTPQNPNRGRPPTPPIPPLPPAPVDCTRSASYFWVGYFIAQGAAPTGQSTGNPTPQPILLGPRRWIDGFEIATNGELGLPSSMDSAGGVTIRDASRTIEGLGLAYRSGNSGNSTQRIHTLPVTSNTSWERCYIRIRTLPSIEEDFWGWFDNIFSQATIFCGITAAGNFIVVKGNGSGGRTTLGQSAILSPGAWYRLDLGITFGSAGSATLYVNGVQAFQVTGVQLGGSGASIHTHSAMGGGFNAISGLFLDVDDWINAGPVGGDAFPLVPGHDLSSGSHVELTRCNGLGPANTWAGIAYQQLRPIPIVENGNPATQQPIASTTPGAVIDCQLDYQLPPGQLGVAAALVAFAYISNQPAGNCTLGYSINGGAYVNTVIANANATWRGVLYTIPSGTNRDAIPAVNTLAIKFTKDASASATSILGPMAVVEVLGIFQPCDSLAAVPSYNAVGVHNSPYPGAYFGFGFAAPIGTFAVLSGTYVGNGTGQDILPGNFTPHWIWIRPVTNPAQDGTFWYSSQLGAHDFNVDACTSSLMPGARINAQTPLFSVAGANAISNQNGVTYQWIAVVDSGMRYMLNGQYLNRSIDSGTDTVPLINPSFTPQRGFFCVEANSSSLNSLRVGTKGPGSTLNGFSPFIAGETTPAMAMSSGILQPQTGVFNGGGLDIAYSMWRTEDGSLQPHLYDDVSYVGNGASNRAITVNVQGAVNQLPIFAIATPTNGASVYRDPSHTGTNSQQIGGAQLTNGIVGFSPNTVTISPGANANGVTYSLFVLGAGVNIGTPPGNQPPFVNPPTPPIPPPGECITFAQAIIELGQLLADQSNVHWTLPELQRYLTEALRTYNAYTQDYRDQGSFQTLAGQAWYDLTLVLANAAGQGLRALTQFTTDLVLDLEYALMEPPNTSSTWSGTAMFTLNDLLTTIERRRDRFLRETNCYIQEDLTAITPPASGRFKLPFTVTAPPRRLAWMMANGFVTPLERVDEWALYQYNRGWQTPADPSTVWPVAYSVSAEPPLTVQLAPPPLAAGAIDCVAVREGFVPDVVANPLVGVPDDYVWAVKFGVLADLLAAPGPANDSIRAELCEQRWNQGITLASRATVVLDAKINGVPAQVHALNDADHFNRSWQNTFAVPTDVLLCGGNIVATSPVSDINAPYTVTLDVVRNMPVPVNLSDCFFDGANAILEPILDYARYLAWFKEGPGQFQDAQAILNRFLIACGMTAMIDQAANPARGPMNQQQVQDARQQPRKLPPEEITDPT